MQSNETQPKHIESPVLLFKLCMRYLFWFLVGCSKTQFVGFIIISAALIELVYGIVFRKTKQPTVHFAFLFRSLQIVRLTN